ncbi:head-tail connector protein [Vibrio sp. H11]|uniref:head-tail connector protein n=1 Tax=Vibrio sp. H11 TaxID=2565928 RepID=UPI0010A6B57F|nr:head-tail connector protein [Vibrio sp. H11]
MLDLDAVRAQCSIDPDQTEYDPSLTLYLAAAKRTVEKFLNRPVYWTADQVPADPDLIPDNALTAHEDTELAVLLLVGHWFEHREAVTESSVKKLPLGLEFLLSFDRDLNL